MTDSLRKSISAAQRKRDPKAGPHGSFPLDPEHLKAAWDLAGHAKNPAAVRAKVRAYARAHGMEDHLPKTAQSGGGGGTGSKGGADEDGTMQKARNADLRAVVHEAYHSTLPGSYERSHLVRSIHRRGLLEHLPASAHTDLHALGLSHVHPNQGPDSGIVPIERGEDEADPQHDADDPANPLLHEHVISKAFNPKVVNGLIVKSWTTENESDRQYIEGWMSTPDRDIEKDITEPEAFLGGPLTDYFARSAPLSLEHGTDTLPAGHLQKAVILRNGKVLESATHPSDPADFAHLPTSGSGVWVRGVLTEEPAKSAVRKGNVGGMSFTGNFTRYVPLPGGGKHFNQPGAINPLLESTVAAYPVNPKAAFQRVQKALGLSDSQTQETSEDMDEEFDFEAFMAAAASRAAEKQKAATAAAEVQKGMTQEQMADLLVAFEERISKSLDERVQKAFAAAAVPPRGEGVGRKGVIAASERTPEEDLEADPINYLIKKANAGEEYSQREKEVAGKLWAKALSEGMAYATDDNKE